MIRKILILTGDHEAPDPTKRGGSYHEEDLATHAAMAEAMMAMPDFEVEVVSRNGAVRARVRPDPDLRRGVVSLTHGFGDLPRKRAKYEDVGANANELLSLDDAARESINAMPHMTGIPVAIRASDRDEGL